MLLLILLSLGGIVWIGLALRELNVVTSQGQNAWTLLQMTTLALPNLLGVIAPFALLIAVVQVLSRLNGDSELIVLTASGATVWTVARPLLAARLHRFAGRQLRQSCGRCRGACGRCASTCCRCGRTC